MVYRHVFWGCLQVGPGGDSMITEAVKTKKYLVRIVTPASYETKEEAKEDEMEYEFCVFGKDPYLFGLPASMKEQQKDSIPPEECPKVDLIRQSDWTRYRMIRIRDMTLDEIGRLGRGPVSLARPTGKKWKKLFPVYGKYPITKVAWSIIAIPDAEKEEEGVHVCRFR